MTDRALRIGVVSTIYPSRSNPASGIFVKEELDALSTTVDIRLLAPRPNHRWFSERGYGCGKADYPVRRPFVFAFPRFFYQRLYPLSLAMTLRLHGRRFFAECDCIHAHNVFAEGVAAVQAFGQSRPVVVTAHGSDINHFACKPDLNPGIISAMNDAAHIICVSNALERSIGELGISTPATVIPNGIDTSFLRSGPKEDACGELGLDPDRPRLLFAGNFVHVKGVEYLLDAVPELKRRVPGCELILIGSGPLEKTYRERIHSLGIGTAVRIHPRVDHRDLAAWYQASDVFVLPSIAEGFGLVAAEALACGRPVVATVSGGPEDIVGEGDGVLVPARNSAALADGIVRVIERQGIRTPGELSASAMARFSYDLLALRIRDVYERIL